MLDVEDPLPVVGAVDTGKVRLALDRFGQTVMRYRDLPSVIAGPLSHIGPSHELYAERLRSLGQESVPQFALDDERALGRPFVGLDNTVFEECSSPSQWLWRAPMIARYEPPS